MMRGWWWVDMINFRYVKIVIDALESMHFSKARDEFSLNLIETLYEDDRQHLNRFSRGANVAARRLGGDRTTGNRYATIQAKLIGAKSSSVSGRTCA